MAKYRIRLEEHFDRDGVGLFLMGDKTDHNGFPQAFHAQPLVIEPHAEGSRIVWPPTLLLNPLEIDAFLAAFAEEAWQRGWRPNISDSGRIKAMEAHLKDLRAINQGLVDALARKG